jgi:electron transport complex protein RnfD
VDGVGRAFLQAAFPIALTTWVPPAGGLAPFRANLALPLLQAPADAVTAATPLGAMKFQQVGTPLLDLFLGNVGGSLGETSAAALLLGGLYLLARRAFDWRIPAGMALAATAIALPLSLLAPARYPSPVFVLLSGGFLLGALFMATDPVTSPTSPLGAWLFGAGAGALVVVIRFWGGLPEGVMYAILLMNAASPLIERVTQPRAFGRRRR